MSMALALEGMVSWLRSKNGWEPNQCGVQYDAMPPNSAGSFYIALDDAGVEGGDDATDSLKETHNITIGVWRRSNYLIKDRKGTLKLPRDEYILGAWTLHDLERLIIVHRSAGTLKHGFHKNYTFMNALNDYWNLPHEEYGAGFITPLSYRGKGRMEAISIETTSGGIEAFLGYRLRFRGLLREQKLRNATDAVG